MGDRLRETAVNLGNAFAGFLPKLLAGLALIGIGLAAGWLAKRIIIRMSMILNLDRLILRLYRRKQLSYNNDVRYGFHNLLGNIGGIVVFLFFLDFAFITWDLNILSRLLEEVIYLVPRIATAAVLVGFGWVVSKWVGKSFQALLDRENVLRSTFIVLYVRVLIILFFSALAAYELNIAREIVVIAFVTVYLTMGIIAVLLVFAKIKSRGAWDDSEE
jgi:hypothetical protein